MSKKDKSFERRRAQDIRCQVKRGYEERIKELEEKVVLYGEIIERKDKEIVRLKQELHRANAMPRSYPGVISGFGAMSKVLDEILREGGEVETDS